MFLHPKKSSGTLWSRYPSGSIIIKFAQAIIVLLIFLTLYNTFPPHHQDVSLDIKQANAKDKKSTPFQGVLDFGHRLLNGTKSLNPQHLKSWTEWTVDPETGALTKNETRATGKIPEARRITAKELMSRPLPKDQTRAPKLLHQSWKDKDLPPKFQRWSQTCRRMNPDWEYVLWTDKDNLALVKKFLPWFKKPYRELTSEIYRADSVRNAYVGVFGGVYADLDTECTRPYDTLFSTYNISTAPYLELNETLPSPPSFPISSSDNDDTKDENVTDIDIDNENENSTSTAAPTTPSITPPQTRKAFLGRMGTDPTNAHSIPNAWMASTPGHPFWLLPLQHIAAKLAANPFDSPEAITGPASLFETINEYNDLFHNTDFPTLDAHYAGSGWGSLYPPPIPAEELVILPFWAIYPFSWQRDGDAYKPHCLVGQESFDAARCKEVIGVEAWGSWSVTYWSHSWSQGGEQQHMEELQDKETIARKKAEKAEEEARLQEEIEEQEEREEKEWEQEMMGELDDDPDDDDDDEEDNGDDGWKGEEDDDIEDEMMLKQELSQLEDDDDDEDDFAIDNNPHHLPSQQKSASTTLKAPTPPNFGTIAEATQNDIPSNRVQKAAAAAAAQQAVDEDDATIASAALAEEEEQRRLDKVKQGKLQQAEDELRFQEEFESEDQGVEEEGFDDLGDGVEEEGELEELDELEENPYVGLLSRTRRLRRARRI